MARVILFPFSRIEGLAFLQVAVFRMVENDVGRAEGGCQLTGVFDGRVVFFIGMEHVSLAVEAKGFVQEPRAAFCIAFFARIVRFIAAADEAFPSCEVQGKAVLLGLGGLNIEEGHGMAGQCLRFPVVDGNEVETLANEMGFLRLEQLLGQVLEKHNDFIVAVNAGFTGILATFHILADHAHHPDDAQEVIDMAVRDDDVAHSHPVVAGSAELAQDAVAATTVDEDAVVRIILQDKACIIALRDQSIAGP